VRGGEQQRRRAHQQNLRHDHDAAAIVPVRKVAGRKSEQQKGRDLDESHVPQHHGGSGLEVEIPAHRHRKHLQAEARKEVSAQEKSKVPRAERRVGVQLFSFAYGPFGPRQNRASPDKAGPGCQTHPS